jgi:hypothetical protein
MSLHAPEPDATSASGGPIERIPVQLWSINSAFAETLADTGWSFFREETHHVQINTRPTS